MTADRLKPLDLPIRQYAEIRTEIRTGDLLLCAGSSVMSRMIQRATASPWSHIALIVRIDSIDRVMVLESVESIGVRAVPLSHYIHDYDGSGRGYPGRIVIARHERFASLPPGRVCGFGQVAADLLGRRYDSAEILRVAARILHSEWRLEPADSAHPVELRRDRSFICSEYVWECFRAAGIAVAPNPRGFIAPRDFAADPAVKGLAEVAIAT